jgi:hypothetical protein
MNFLKAFFEFAFLIIISIFMFFYLILEELYKKFKNRKK